MKGLIRRVILLACVAVAALCVRANAQNVFEGTVSFDKTIHDFGDIMIADGPQKCTFKVKNIGSKPVVIYRVITSCGCTEPSWTEAPIRPGDTGEISVMFSNDQGPYPFDKTVTVYISALSKPVILKVRGVAHDRAKSLQELFPIACGPLGLRQKAVSMGQLEQGLSGSIEIEVANTSGRKIEIGFENLTPGLSVSVPDNIIPAKSRTRLTCVVDTRKTDGQQWGHIPFTFTLSVDGKKYPAALTVDALIKENFSSLTESQKRAGALPQFESSSIDFGLVGKGEVLEGEFVFKNMGKDTFRIYKADASEGGVETVLPEPVPYGEKGVLRVKADAGSKSGEMLNILTLITNSPTRPVINLFILYTVR